MARRLEARDNFVIIKADPKKEISKGGIHLLETRQQETDCMGTVISVGPGTHAFNPVSGELQLVPTTIKVGDRVLFSPMGGQKIYYELEPETIEKIDGKDVKKGGVEEFFVVQQHNLVCFVDQPL